jgi:hypothetical protein
MRDGLLLLQAVVVAAMSGTCAVAEGAASGFECVWNAEAQRLECPGMPGNTPGGSTASAGPEAAPRDGLTADELLRMIEELLETEDEV